VKIRNPPLWLVTWFAATLVFGIATLFVVERWAIAAFDLSLLALTIVAVLLQRGDVRPPILLLVPALALFQIVTARSVDAWNTGESLLDWLTFASAFWLGGHLLASERVAERFLRAAAIGGVMLAVIAMFQQAMGPGGYFGPFVYRNQFAAFLEALLPIAILAAIDDRRRMIWWIAAAAAMFASVVAAGSRAGTAISFTLLFLVPAAASIRGWISRVVFLRFAAAVLVSAAVLTFVAGWETIWARFQEPHPYSLREDLVRSTLDMIAARPWTGWGLGTWSTAYPAYARFDDGSFVNQAHNDWLQWAAEGGIPLLLLMLWVVWRAAGPAWRSLWGIGILAVFVHALLDYPFQQRPALAAFFFALLGAAARRYESVSRE